MSIIFRMLKYLKNYSNLIKSVAIIALTVISTISIICLFNYKSSYKEEVKSGLARQTELDSIKKQNKELQTQISEQDSVISDLNSNLSNKDKEIQELKEGIKALENKIQSLEKTSANLANARSGSFKADGNYDQATQVWNSLKGLGLNDYVCAGILGNIMAEVGGQTLDISRWAYYAQTNTNYYGICQWSGGRKQRLLNDFGTTLDDQIRFLSVELFEVIPKGNSFYNMQDEKQAALYFAKYYERCGSGSYSVRQTNATKALQYFTQ